MALSPELLALANYLAGEFDNREQALAEPVWYVHLRLWQRPVPLFTEDSLTLFAEQANIIYLDKPYRQRIIRLQQTHPQAPIQAQYYMPKDPKAVSGAGSNPDLLNTLTPEQLELLPGCILTVTHEKLAANRYEFSACPPPNTRCCFTYLGNTVQVELGFKATPEEFLSYDKGIEQGTGKATWGAILGPYRYSKRQELRF
ncbi:MAG: chromophore lyase CpcT/CpeT [Nostocaceae cyanobacterium]|nr:chromophore lyase CpcT/CpeT [Nostocaceae cyanobacterium]